MEKNWDKRYINNQKENSLLNFDTKIFSKAISIKLKTVLPTLFSSQEIACVKNKFIGESGVLISDITEITGCFSIKSFLVTMEKLLTLQTIASYFRLEKV